MTIIGLRDEGPLCRADSAERSENRRIISSRGTGFVSNGTFARSRGLLDLFKPPARLRGLPGVTAPAGVDLASGEGVQPRPCSNRSRNDRRRSELLSVLPTVGCVGGEGRVSLGTAGFTAGDPGAERMAGEGPLADRNRERRSRPLGVRGSELRFDPDGTGTRWGDDDIRPRIAESCRKMSLGLGPELRDECGEVTLGDDAVGRRMTLGLAACFDGAGRETVGGPDLDRSVDLNRSLRELGGLPCPRSVNCLDGGELGLTTLDDEGRGTVNDGLGDVEPRAGGWLGVGDGRLVGAEKLRNSFGTLGGAEARAGLREGAGRLGIWIRGPRLGEGDGRLGIWILGVGRGDGRADDCGRLAFMRD